MVMVISGNDIGNGLLLFKVNCCYYPWVSIEPVTRILKVEGCCDSIHIIQGETPCSPSLQKGPYSLCWLIIYLFVLWLNVYFHFSWGCSEDIVYIILGNYYIDELDSYTWELTWSWMKAWIWQNEWISLVGFLNFQFSSFFLFFFYVLHTILNGAYSTDITDRNGENFSFLSYAIKKNYSPCLISYPRVSHLAGVYRLYPDELPSRSAVEGLSRMGSCRTEGGQGRF